jgi:hypothetical protein
MPGRAMAANAGVLRTRSVRLVLARSVTTTLAPAAAHSFLSLHRTCRGSQAEAVAVAVAWAGAPAPESNQNRGGQPWSKSRRVRSWGLIG